MAETIEAYSTRLTTAGAAAIVKAIFEGTKVDLSVSLWGDGNGETYEPTTDQTALRNLKYTGSVTKVEINAEQTNMLDIYCDLSTEVGGFTVREVAIPIGETDELFCVGCVPPAEKVVGTSLAANEMSVVLHVIVADASVVTFTLTDSVQYLQQRDMDAHETDEDTHKNLWIPGVFVAKCTTAAATKTKTATCAQMLNRQPGTMARVTFTYAGNVTSTLNIAGTGAASLVTLDGDAANWKAGDELIVQYDGTNWVELLNLSAEERAKAEMRQYGVCRTIATAAAKTCAISGYQLVTGTRVNVQFLYANTAVSPTLNINSTGAKPLYLNGAACPADLFADGAVLALQYNGTAYEILGDFGAANSSTFGRVRVTDEADSTKTAAKGWAASAAALADYIKTSEKGAAKGVATLAKDKKVESSQLRGGWTYQEDQPDDTTLLWITDSGTMLFYDGSEWKNVLPVWG